MKTSVITVTCTDSHVQSSVIHKDPKIETIKCAWTGDQMNTLFPIHTMEYTQQ